MDRTFDESTTSDVSSRPHFTKLSTLLKSWRNLKKHHLSLKDENDFLSLEVKVRALEDAFKEARRLEVYDQHEFGEDLLEVWDKPGAAEYAITAIEGKG